VRASCSACETHRPASSRREPPPMSATLVHAPVHSRVFADECAGALQPVLVLLPRAARRRAL
jgi:hypothetical protein